MVFRDRVSAVQEREGRIMANAHQTSAVQCSALTVPIAINQFCNTEK